MTLLDIVSKIRHDERVTVVGDEVLVDCLDVAKLRASNYFKKELATKEVIGIGVGLFGELSISIKE